METNKEKMRTEEEIRERIAWLSIEKDIALDSEYHEDIAMACEMDKEMRVLKWVLNEEE